VVAQARDTGLLRGAAKPQDVLWWQVLGWHDDGVTPIPAWFPEEMDLAGRENLDDDHVARYDATIDAHAAAAAVEEHARDEHLPPSLPVSL
jgi:hypothetical protein